jgi:hypothetical protein
MRFNDEVLNRLAPALSWEPDWADVLGRAGEPERHRLWGKRRLILILAVLLAAVLIPLIALGAENEWWFLKGGGAPTPTSPPVVVKEGNWDGHPWELVAFRSAKGRLCLSVTPTGSKAGVGGAFLNCGSFAGISRTNLPKATRDLPITLIGAGATDGLPAYIAGSVVENASQIEIRFENGRVLRVPTFTVPTSVGRVRLYAAPLPVRAGEPIKLVAGIDNDGNVVACVVSATVGDGISPLSACK